MNTQPILQRAAACLVFALGIAACDPLPGGTKSDPVTLIAPQVKIGLPEAGPTSRCNHTVRYWFEGDEIDPGVPESLDRWYVHYENLEPIDFTDPVTGGITWHCVFASPFANREPPYEGWEDQLHYEVIPLVPDSLVYDEDTIVVYQGSCAVPADSIVEDATTYVNFSTTAASCIIGTSPLAAFP